MHQYDTSPAVQSEPQVPSGLISFTKAATVSLSKRGLTGQRAAVYLVLDRSASMASYYASGAVQHLAEQALGLSAALDDDGVVPLIFFDNRTYPSVDISLNAYQGAIAHLHAGFGGEETMGGTRYAIAMHAVLEHRQVRGSAGPAFVIAQTDGLPQDRGETIAALQGASHQPVFWSWVSFGHSPVPFLQQLDTLPGRAVDNASYFHAGTNPQGMSDADLYDGLTAGYGPWLRAASAAGIL